VGFAHGVAKLTSFAGLIVMTNTHTHRKTQTDRPHICSNSPHLVALVLATWPKATCNFVRCLLL